MNTDLFATIVSCIILAGLTIFQLALICGAPIAKYAWGGQHTFLPSRLRIGSAISIIVYGIIATVLLSKAGVVDTFAPIADVGSWVVAIYFWLGTILNAISRSKPERNIMTPVALALAILTTIIALA